MTLHLVKLLPKNFLKKMFLDMVMTWARPHTAVPQAGRSQMVHWHPRNSLDKAILWRTSLRTMCSATGATWVSPPTLRRLPLRSLLPLRPLQLLWSLRP